MARGLAGDSSRKAHCRVVGMTEGGFIRGRKEGFGECVAGFCPMRSEEGVLAYELVEVRSDSQGRVRVRWCMPYDEGEEGR
ncbi:hypothetical protein A3K55_02160 [Candidatus Shapirobacteria bacterium RBG_13_44_7]|uniref:Uncharacterized protein n=1 Tax=Candidatus Shapirobacteria bacterium RBG_13_44_7 TaxID=1802149 RepID=A0A1F7SGK6_9BACT|nr:MAG: hypothetical protein A3K55_02160 [Candidatus Shapirobacteria bacterium RBG_13_44_7]